MTTVEIKLQEVPTWKLSKTTRTAMQRYGVEQCLWAYDQHCAGQGPSFIGGGHVGTGDAMINAGREMRTGKREA